jgi:threonine/homoserine efflux transporter RhtA
LLTEIDTLLAVNTALDTKLMAVMMSMHARLGAASGLRVLDDHLVTMICDLFCR